MTNKSKIVIAKACKGLELIGIKCKANNQGIKTDFALITYDGDKMEFAIDGKPAGYFDALYSWAKTIA